MTVDDFRPVTLNTGKAICNADWIWTDVCSPFARIYYVVSGAASIDVQGITYSLQPDYLYLVPPFMKHSTMCKGTFIHYYLHVYVDDVSETGFFEVYDFPIKVQAQKNDRQLFERLVELNPTLSLERFNPREYDNKQQLAQTITSNKQRCEWVKIETRGIVFQILSRFMAKANVKPYANNDRIIQSIRRIREHLSETIAIPQLAEEAGLSSGHFIHLFSQATGMSPKLFLCMKRIERAQYLLHTTMLPIKEIALRVGYSDNSYFVRLFKNSVGMTPSEYRNRLLREQNFY